jgi:hypothetical protein
MHLSALLCCEVLIQNRKQKDRHQNSSQNIENRYLSRGTFY